MLQTALAAEQDGADPVLVASALLHDYGHLVHELPEDAAEHGVDTLHEEAGAAWLEQHFVPRVTEPLRLHVLAKRYLCATGAGVPRGALAGLAPQPAAAGRAVHARRGGRVRARSLRGRGVRLRRWDDVGKIEASPRRRSQHYRPALAPACAAPTPERR